MTHLKYQLEELPGDKLGFQILEQSDAVTEFLKTTNFKDTETGLKVCLDEYPEFEESTNTIFVRGTSKKDNLKVDVTRFVSPRQLNGHVDMFVKTLKHFTKHIEKLEKAKFVDNKVDNNKKVHLHID